jgi:hypothetical protein
METDSFANPLFDGQFQVLTQQRSVHIFLVRLDDRIAIVRGSQLMGVGGQAGGKGYSLMSWVSEGFLVSSSF